MFQVIVNGTPIDRHFPTREAAERAGAKRRIASIGNKKVEVVPVQEAAPIRTPTPRSTYSGELPPPRNALVRPPPPKGELKVRDRSAEDALETAPTLPGADTPPSSGGDALAGAGAKDDPSGGIPSILGGYGVDRKGT